MQNTVRNSVFLAKKSEMTPFWNVKGLKQWDHQNPQFAVVRKQILLVS